MNRSDLLAAKAQELTESLQEWAKVHLASGDQLVVSLRVQNVPLVVIDPGDDHANKEHILNMKVLDFFTVERLESFPSGSGIPTRTRTCLTNGRHVYQDMTIDSFIRETGEAYLLRTPNFGRKCLQLVKEVLKYEGLNL